MNMAQNSDGQLPQKLNNADDTKKHTTLPSKQLLYSEKFSDDSLKIYRNDLKSSKVAPKTFKLPPSSVLSQVKNFLPKMMDANHKLEEQIQNEPDKLDIENVDGEERYIEMNLAVVEDENSSDSDSSDSDSSDSDSDSSDSDSESSDKDVIKLTTADKNKNRKIEILSDKISESDP